MKTSVRTVLVFCLFVQLPAAALSQQENKKLGNQTNRALVDDPECERERTLDLVERYAGNLGVDSAQNLQIRSAKALACARAAECRLNRQQWDRASKWIEKGKGLNPSSNVFAVLKGLEVRMQTEAHGNLEVDCQVPRNVEIEISLIPRGRQKTPPRRHQCPAVWPDLKMGPYELDFRVAASNALRLRKSILVRGAGNTTTRVLDPQAEVKYDAEPGDVIRLESVEGVQPPHEKSTPFIVAVPAGAYQLDVIRDDKRIHRIKVRLQPGEVFSRRLPAVKRRVSPFAPVSNVGPKPSASRSWYITAGVAGFVGALGGGMLGFAKNEFGNAEDSHDEYDMSRDPIRVETLRGRVINSRDRGRQWQTAGGWTLGVGATVAVTSFIVGLVLGGDE